MLSMRVTGWASGLTGRGPLRNMRAASVDQQHELPAHVTVFADTVRLRDVGQRERLPDGERELTASHNWLRIAGSVIFSSRASSIALLTMTDSVRSPSNGR